MTSRFWFGVLLLFSVSGGGFLIAQTPMKLPLPVESPPGATSFESPAPMAAILTGVLWPSSGPLTSWAPVYSTLEADGSLKEAPSGGWVGRRPDRWIKVVRPGFVVAGFRVLVKTGPGTTETRQAQVFWKPWVDGESRGDLVPSSVHGLAAGPRDQVKIVEIRLPEGAVPVGLYGETGAGEVIQASLLVRLAEVRPDPSSVNPIAPMKGPQEPSAPTLSPLAPVDLRGISQEER